MPFNPKIVPIEDNVPNTALDPNTIIESMVLFPQA